MSTDRPVAPAWHTGLVLTLLGAGAWCAVYVRQASDHPRLAHPALYTFIIVLEWVLFAVTLWRSDPTFVASIVREPRSLWKDVLTAVAIGVALIVVAVTLFLLLGPAGGPSLRGMAPRKGAETVLWTLAGISAGISEETVFRGYLQRQIAAWTGLTSVGIVVQAIVFGLCHAYQGWRHVVLIGAWGLVFGLAAWLRRGLRGNMIAHAAVDIVSGLVLGSR